MDFVSKGRNLIHFQIFTVASVASIGIFFAFPCKVAHLVAFVALFTVATEVTSTATAIPAVALARVAVKTKGSEKKTDKTKLNNHN